MVDKGTLYCVDASAADSSSAWYFKQASNSSSCEYEYGLWPEIYVRSTNLRLKARLVKGKNYQFQNTQVVLNLYRNLWKLERYLR